MSARFGDRKSWFLSKFIKKYEKQFLFIPIFPVNYQVAENKDIFEYIKRDILIRLLASGEIEIDDTTISNSIYLYYYLQQNNLNISSDLLSIAPDINLNGTDISLSALGLAIKAFNKIKSKFEEYKTKFKNDEQKAKDFIENYEKEKGSIYEFDIISQLICDIIIQYKSKYKNRRKVVLLIEDLDRIDPAHIFRILNIFSAHFDRYDVSYTEMIKTQGSNKFSFDKIVSVCHYENVKSTYHHFYGEKTDFNGYIGKFSTAKPFYYSLQSELKNYILKHIHPDLLKFPRICEILVSMIVNKYKETAEGLWGSLRYIASNLQQTESIRKEYVIIDSEWKICSINNLTRLLDLLHRFDLNWNILFRYYNNYADAEQNLIISQCWLYAKFEDEKLRIMKGNSSCLDFGHRDTTYSTNCKVVINDNIIENFDIDLLIKNSYLKTISSALLHKKTHILKFFNSYINNSTDKTID